MTGHLRFAPVASGCYVYPNFGTRDETPQIGRTQGMLFLRGAPLVAGSFRLELPCRYGDPGQAGGKPTPG